MAAVDLFVQRVITDDRWMNDAACRGLTHLFFPLPAERPQARGVAKPPLATCVAAAR